MCSRVGWLKPPSKYRALIKGCYPEDDPDDFNLSPKEAGKLKAYALKYPTKLTKSGKFLEKEVKKNVSKAPGWAAIDCDLVTMLVEVSGEDGTLLGAYPTKVYGILLGSTPAHKALALRNLKTYVDYQDPSSWSFVDAIFTKVAACAASDSVELRGLALEVVDSCVYVYGSLVAADLEKTVDICFSALQSAPKELSLGGKTGDGHGASEEDGAAMTGRAAMAVLKRAMNSGHDKLARAVVRGACKYLTQHKLWENEFAGSLMSAITRATSVPYAYLVFSNLVQEFDHANHHGSHGSTLIPMLRVMTTAAKDTTAVGHWILEVVSVLVSAYFAAKDNNVAGEILNAVEGIAAVAADSPALVDVLTMMIQQLAQADRKKGSEDAVRSVLSSCIKVTTQLNMKAHPTYPDSLLKAFMDSFLTVHANTRKGLLDLFVVTLALRIKSAATGALPSQFRMPAKKDFKKVHDFFRKEQQDQVRSTMADVLFLRDTEPSHAQYVHRIMSVFIDEDASLELNVGSSAYFYIQEQADGAPSASLQRMAHAVVAGLFVQLSRKASGTGKLAEYVAKVVADMKSSGMFKELEVSVAKQDSPLSVVSDKAGDTSKPSQTPENLLFSKETFIENVGKNHSRVNSVLSRPYAKPNTRKTFATVSLGSRRTTATNKSSSRGGSGASGLAPVTENSTIGDPTSSFAAAFDAINSSKSNDLRNVLDTVNQDSKHRASTTSSGCTLNLKMERLAYAVN